MYKRLKFICYITIVFLSGMGVSNNLSNLVETNPMFNAAWWKIWASLIIGAFFAAMAYFVPEKED